MYYSVLQIEEFTLKQSCTACPEQYDVFIGEEVVGYLRLRHGFFRVECPYIGGAIVYEAEPQGDGSFKDEERDFYLKEAISAIRNFMERG